MIKAWVVPLVLTSAMAVEAHAAGQTETVETDPIRCWWRTSVPAVRVGEPFSVVLTCAVVETEDVTVVPNQAELDPNSMQLPPFDVVGGSQGEDLRTADHRFFQYEYRARLISDELFDKDVKLPELKIAYTVRTRVNGEAVEGRDQSYVLPETSIRVLSLVPADATDIRDATRETFEDIDRRISRANILRLVGGVLIGFAVLAALVALARVAGGARRRAPAARSLVSDSAILRQVGHELAALERARRESDWTPAHTARLLTALRIISAYALELPARPLAAAATAGAWNASDGQLAVHGARFRGSDATVAGWVTPVVIAQERERLEKLPGASHRRVEMLEQLEKALTRLTVAQYGREKATGSERDAAVDDALAVGSSTLRRLKAENMWVAKKLRALPWSR